MVSNYRNIVVLGFGNIGQALSPLLRTRFASEHILVIDDRMEQEQKAIAERYAMDSLKFRIDQKNFTQILSQYVERRTLVLNLATSICSRDLIVWTQSIGAFYLDTCIDPWEYQDGVVHSSENTNYEMREEILDLIRLQEAVGVTPTATAVVAHGANPGFVSILVKQGLLKMQQELLHRKEIPETQSQWAQLAQALGVRIIQISEKDTQDSSVAMQPGEFVNTWSVDGYVAEALQPAELGWGTHEESGPMAASIGRHVSGCQAAVYLKHMGVSCEVKSWAPGAGEFVGNLISHNEAISLAHYLTLGAESNLVYRPTVYYAYRPCAQASFSLNLLDSGNRSRILKSRVLKDEIESGIDELGVLIISDKLPSLWIGSQLSIDRARELAPYNNATSLQVVSSVMAALEWMLLNPEFGITESERLDHVFLYKYTKAYWAPLVSKYCSWHPEGNGSERSWTIDKFLSIRMLGADIDAKNFSNDLDVESAHAVQY
jgi:homospermidine synthase